MRPGENSGEPTATSLLVGRDLSQSGNRFITFEEVPISNVLMRSSNSVTSCYVFSSTFTLSYSHSVAALAAVYSNRTIPPSARTMHRMPR